MNNAARFLQKLPRYASGGASALKAGLERIKALLEEMGDPQAQYDIALIAGTNGKGSTASMMAACLSACGITVGLHTSPHLLHLRERMRVDGASAGDAWLDECVLRYNSVFESVRPSFYEATLALSLLFFAQQRVSLAVVETGLGGRLDATNALDASLCVITGIALDHTDILGETTALIASEKAGIIKPGKPVVIGKMDDDARRVIERAARAANATVFDSTQLISSRIAARGLVRFSSEDRILDGVRLSLGGVHQISNAATALCSLQVWKGEMDGEGLKRGLENVAGLAGLRARCEIARECPLLMIDVAHNPDSVATTLATFFRRVDSSKTPVIIIGMLCDKDITGVARELARYGSDLVVTGIDSHRGLSEDDLRDRLLAAGITGLRTANDVRSVLEKAHRENTDCLVLGSHVVAATALRSIQDKFPPSI